MSSLLNRRELLKALGTSAAAAAAYSMPMMRALAAPADASGEYFIFIHAQGAWDVTTWSDPRNREAGLVNPATEDVTDFSNIRNYIPTDVLDGAGRLVPGPKTFTIGNYLTGAAATSCNFRFGPGIGNLKNHYQRLCLINGISMNTVAHADGVTFSATGRHLAGGRASQPSIDTVMANEVGRGDTFPVVSVRFPSYYVGGGLDSRVVPLRVGNVGAMGSALNRNALHTSPAERQAVTLMLAEEAREIGRRAFYDEEPTGLANQFENLQDMLGFNTLFQQNALKALPHLAPFFPTNAVDPDALNFAFAAEAINRKAARCVSFALGSFDTHNTNYQGHLALQQKLFDLIAALLDVLGGITDNGRTLADRTHILVVSDFCRTPMINLSEGRDHYPNNSALIISNRFVSNPSGGAYGATDALQLLPTNAPASARFQTNRPMTPADVLVTYLAAFSATNPRGFFRDGEVIRGILAGG